MALQLEAMQPSDIDSFINIQQDAFAAAPSNHLRIFYPQGRTPSHAKNLKDVNTQYNLIRDSQTDEIISVAKWNFQPNTRSREELDAEETKARQERAEQAPVEDIDFGVISVFREAQAKAKRAILGGRAYVYLHILATAPEHQGRGAGSMQLEWGLAKAEALGLPVYLESTMTGQPLYLHHGFKPVVQLDCNARDYGLDDRAEHWCMIREPKGKAETAQSVVAGCAL